MWDAPVARRWKREAYRRLDQCLITFVVAIEEPGTEALYPIILAAARRLESLSTKGHAVRCELVVFVATVSPPLMHSLIHSAAAPQACDASAGMMYFHGPPRRLQKEPNMRVAQQPAART